MVTEWLKDLGLHARLEELAVANWQEEQGERELEIGMVAAANQARLLKIFQTQQVGETDFYPSTGYGYDDWGRDKLDRIYAETFGAERALVRQQIVSGTHALAICLFGVLGPGDVLVAATGAPYDTLDKVIGHDNNERGSLAQMGVGYREIPLKPDHGPNLEALDNLLQSEQRVRMVLIQRSRGYAWRPSLSLEQVAAIINVVKKRKPDIVCLVDNCYGEFTDTMEPPAIGADLAAGSLIKNPGGGLAPCGGYVVGRSDLVEMAATRLTAPGIGAEAGATLDVKRLFYQGLFLAPHVVAEALTGMIFAARTLEALGFAVSPTSTMKRHDIIQAIRFQGAKELLSFCQGIQKASPIDSGVLPQPAPMPGYTHEVVMACGTFIQGASVELSADAPLREPYIGYLQGGLTADHARLAIVLALQHMVNTGTLQLS